MLICKALPWLKNRNLCLRNRISVLIISKQLVSDRIEYDRRELKQVENESSSYEVMPTSCCGHNGVIPLTFRATATHAAATCDGLYSTNS